MPVKFSIIIPTRNRAHLLQNALKSADSQRFENYEILVSDNFSSDNTAEVVRSFHDRRIRYVRTEKPLSMPESWSFALSNAKGEFVTILSDDSVLSPSLLEDTAAALKDSDAEVITWPYALYFHPSWENKAERNKLKFAPFFQQKRILNSRDELTAFYSGIALSAASPAIYKAFYRKDIVKKIQGKGSGLFFPIAPDYSSCAAILFSVEKLLFMDKPYTLMGTAKESIGYSCSRYRGKAFHDFMAEFGEKNLFRHVPLKILTERNCIAETLLRARENFKSKIDINREVYFTECYRDLLKLEKNQINVKEEKEEILALVKKKGYPLLQAKLKNLPDPPDEDAWPVSIHGSKRGFHDILSALAFLEKEGKKISSIRFPLRKIKHFFGKITKRA